MRRLLTVVSALLLSPTALRADWIIFKNGTASHVLAVELTGRAVNTLTLKGKRWSVLSDHVDIPRTRRANVMPGDTQYSPGWIVFVGAPKESQPGPRATRKPAPAVLTVAAPSTSNSAQVLRVQATSTAQTPLPTEPQLSVPAPPSSVMATIPSTSEPYRFSVYVNGAVGTEQVHFAETRSFELFSEQASIDSVYRDPKQQGVELGGFFHLKGPIGVGASVEHFQNNREAIYSASIPHPFFFDRFREISGAASGLTSQETAAHLDAFVTKTWGPISVDFFGGPSSIPENDAWWGSGFREIVAMGTVVDDEVDLASELSLYDGLDRCRVRLVSAPERFETLG